MMDGLEGSLRDETRQAKSDMKPRQFGPRVSRLVTERSCTQFTSQVDTNKLKFPSSTQVSSTRETRADAKMTPQLASPSGTGISFTEGIFICESYIISSAT